MNLKSSSGFHEECSLCFCILSLYPFEVFAYGRYEVVDVKIQKNKIN
jgi:hypothetical protein